MLSARSRVAEATSLQFGQGADYARRQHYAGNKAIRQLAALPLLLPTFRA